MCEVDSFIIMDDEENLDTENNVEEDIIFDITKLEDGVTFKRLIEEADSGREICEIIDRLPGNTTARGKGQNYAKILSFVRSQKLFEDSEKTWNQIRSAKKQKDIFLNAVYNINDVQVAALKGNL